MVIPTCFCMQHTRCPCAWCRQKKNTGSRWRQRWWQRVIFQRLICCLCHEVTYRELPSLSSVLQAFSTVLLQGHRRTRCQCVLDRQNYSATRQSHFCGRDLQGCTKTGRLLSSWNRIVDWVNVNEKELKMSMSRSATDLVTVMFLFPFLLKHFIGHGHGVSLFT